MAAQNTIQAGPGAQTAQMLSACAAWRGLTVEDPARLYIEGWIDVDFPEMRGRHTRRSMHRDGPLGLEAKVARHDWLKEPGDPKEN
jgi:hypothetical protein